MEGVEDRRWDLGAGECSREPGGKGASKGDRERLWEGSKDMRFGAVSVGGKGLYIGSDFARSRFLRPEPG